MGRDRHDRPSVPATAEHSVPQSPVLPSVGATHATPAAPRSPIVDIERLDVDRVDAERAERERFDAAQRVAAPAAAASPAPAAPARAAAAPAAPSTPADPRITRPRRASRTVAKRPLAAPTVPADAADEPRPRRSLTSAFMRRQVAIPALSFIAVFGFTGGSLVNPFAANIASAAVIAAPAELRSAPSQSYSPHGTYATGAISRDGYDITKPVVKPVVKAPAATTTTTTTTKTTASSSSSSTTATASAPVAGTPDPGSAQAIAQQMVAARGWDASQYSCLVSLWNRESGWNVYAYNPSGAYGIPQALPGSKMATAGADWQTNPATQITWGLNYITGSYGTPCGAWAHSQAFNWY